MVWQIERDDAVSRAEKSEGCGKVEADEDDEQRRTAIEQDRQEQRERISRWKVSLANVIIIIVIAVLVFTDMLSISLNSSASDR